MSETSQLTNKTFGRVFAAVFCFIALYPILTGQPIRPWAIVVSASFLVFSVFAPKMLQPLKFAYLKLADAIGRLINFVWMFLIFYGVFMPIGLIMRLVGKDNLKLAFDKKSSTYWIPRNPPGPAPKSMVNPF